MSFKPKTLNSTHFLLFFGGEEEELFELELTGLKFQLFIDQIRFYILVVYQKPSNFPINEIQKHI